MPLIPLTPAQRKLHRADAHHLDPVVMIGNDGLTPAVRQEADAALKAHGLIQAYSRTNRILNSVKTYGNIVSFRNLEQETNEALALFGNKDAKGIVLLKPYASRGSWDGMTLSATASPLVSAMRRRACSGSST